MLSSAVKRNRRILKRKRHLMDACVDHYADMLRLLSEKQRLIVEREQLLRKRSIKS